jgi:hypothetical protein
MEQLLRKILNLFGRSRFRGYTIRDQKYKPLLKLLNELERRDICLAKLDALEIFGRDGVDHTTTYADKMKSLEVWELDERLLAPLSQNLPGALIRIVDSYEEVSNTKSKYDLVVVDNAIGLCRTRCDHFDLFPDLIFKIAKEEALLVLNVIPNIDSKTLKYFPSLTEADYLEIRKRFYNVDDPIDISKDRILDVYKGFVERNDYRLIWSLYIKRNGAGVYYLVLKIKSGNQIGEQ